MTQKTAAEWFAVDKDGLGEMFANFPKERLVTELVQNAFDEESSLCAVTIAQCVAHTAVEVRDDNPEGFKNMRDAYTLFGHTKKRQDPTKRGRFNLGEKIVFAAAQEAKVLTTKGVVTFDKQGRRESKTGATDGGSIVAVTYPRWDDKDYDQAMRVLRGLYPPRGICYTVNGDEVPHVEPMAIAETTLATEFMKQVDGQMVMTKTARKTEIWFYPKRHDTAYLCEMGIPVCEIDGKFDADVQQKIPLSQDRTLVPQSYIQDIYAEMLMVLGDQIEPGDLGRAHVRAALEDERVDAVTAAALFKQEFGDDAVIQSHDPDSDQEAARQGATIVSSRTFGADVNAKLRQGGVKTAREVYCRDLDAREAELGLPNGFKELEHADHRDALEAYTKFLCQRLYGRRIQVKFAQWLGTNTAATYSPRSLFRGDECITYNVMRVTKEMMAKPISECTGLVVHELTHCCRTQGHDGIYDAEYERNIAKLATFMLADAAAFRQFEPTLS